MVFERDPKNGVVYNCEFFAFTYSRPMIETIRSLEDVDRLRQQILTYASLMPSGFHVTIGGDLLWDGHEYSFDEVHTSKAVQVTINRFKYEMYREFYRLFDVFELVGFAGPETYLVGRCRL